MKTTIDIADPQVVEQGLRRVLADEPAAANTDKPVTFKGDGLQPGIDLADWERILDLAYKGRGA